MFPDLAWSPLPGTRPRLLCVPKAPSCSPGQPLLSLLRSRSERSFHTRAGQEPSTHPPASPAQPQTSGQKEGCLPALSSLEPLQQRPAVGSQGGEDTCEFKHECSPRDGLVAECPISVRQLGQERQAGPTKPPGAECEWLICTSSQPHAKAHSKRHKLQPESQSHSS